MSEIDAKGFHCKKGVSNMTVYARAKPTITLKGVRGLFKEFFEKTPNITPLSSLNLNKLKVLSKCIMRKRK